MKYEYGLILRKETRDGAQVAMLLGRSDQSAPDGGALWSVLLLVDEPGWWKADIIPVRESDIPELTVGRVAV